MKDTRRKSLIGTVRNTIKRTRSVFSIDRQADDTIVKAVKRNERLIPPTKVMARFGLPFHSTGGGWTAV